MVTVLLSWLYIAFLCTLIGIGVLGVFKNIQFSWIYYLAAGIVVITVYTEYFSLFAKIGAMAHILLFFSALVCGYVRRAKLRILWKTYAPVVCSSGGVFLGCFILLIAFFTSRGEFHTDTNIYHAAAIRLYEEYGVLKGAGNLQLHYAYNSAYLAFASIFSLRWLFGQSIHTTTGFLEVIMCLYAFYGLKEFKRHKRHMTDMMKVGILFYTLVNMTRSMSPATDYAVMYFVLFIITAWCEQFEFGGGANDVTYILLSLAAVFTVTLKFSACLLVLIAVCPAFFLLKDRKWKTIAVCTACGILIMLPFFIRNYYISGWLLYPFDGIDIFHVEWKIPKEYLLVDADQIKVWGRCLYDVSKIDLPVSEWIVPWWEHQFRYEQMFLGAAAISAVLQITVFIMRLMKKQKPCLPLVALHIAIWCNIAVWFFMAPFIRYGLAFLFAVIMIAVGDCLSMKRSGFGAVLTGGLLFCILVSVSPYWDQYITDAGVFIKQRLREPYYIFQQDYDRAETAVYEINGQAVYYPVNGEINDCHVYPGTCYRFMIERSTLISEEIEDGFRAQ